MADMSSATPKADAPPIRVTLRTTEAADLDQVVNLNNTEASVIDEMTRESLSAILEKAAYVRVADLNGEIVGLLVGYHSDDDFDCEAMSWFRPRHSNFFFIERIVVSDHARRMGLGGALYDDLSEFASRRNSEIMTCTVSVRPRNEPALAFHKRQGFRAVGEAAGEGTCSIMLSATVEQSD